MRTIQHVIDTRAMKKVMISLPDHWVVRELSERDYGIDLMVEIFNSNNLDKDCTYKSTGASFHIQVKGTTQELKPGKEKTVNFSFKKNSLLYAENFSTPSLLFYVDVSSQSGEIYFVWLQRYIKDILELQESNWREEKKDTIRIKIPIKNSLKNKINKIEKIASRPKFIEELVEFRERYSNLREQLKNVATGKFNLTIESMQRMRQIGRQLLSLQTLFKYNHCCVDRSSIKELTIFLDKLSPSSSISEFVNIPEEYNLSLLENSIDSISDIENFIMENEKETVY